MVALLLLTTCASPVGADSPLDALHKAQEEQQVLQEQRQNAESQLEQVYYQQEETRIALLVEQSELAIAIQQLTLMEVQMAQATHDLQRIEAQVKATEQRYLSRKAILGTRLRALQQNGRVSYLGVLLGATRFADFIGRFEAIKQMVKLDAELLTDIRTDKETLERQRQQQEARKEELTSLKVQAEAHKATSEAKVFAVGALSQQMAEQKRLLQAAIAEYDRQHKELEDQIWQIQQQINRPAGRFAPSYPLKGKPIVTDDFGYGPDPIRGGQRLHHGTDFAGNMDDPIWAIEDGEVIATRYDDSYGNLIILDHGGGIASWYGHTSAYVAKLGDKVKRGQVIAKVGSTGYSTGPHLHLEIRVGGAVVDPMSYFH